MRGVSIGMKDLTQLVLGIQKARMLLATAFKTMFRSSSGLRVKALSNVKAGNANESDPEH
jgi:phosphoenolpyruvate synthase/pyruvate phosphate dikinase